MRTDPLFCANSFLTYRAIVDRNRQFTPALPPKFHNSSAPRRPITDSFQLEAHLRSVLAAVDGAVVEGGSVIPVVICSLPPTGTCALRRLLTV